MNSVSSERRRRHLALQRRRKRLREQHAEIKTQDALAGASRLARRDQAEFSALFELLAARYGVGKVNEFLKFLGNEVHVLEDEDSDRPQLMTRLLASMNRSKSDDVKRLSLQFLLHSGKASTEDNGLPSFTEDEVPQLKQVLKVLLKARARALRLQLFWGNDDLNEASMSSRQNREKVLKLREVANESKSEEDQLEEAKQLAQFLCKSLPSHSFAATVGLFEKYVGHSSASGLNEKDDKIELGAAVKPFAMIKLSANLEKATGSHFHIVATRVANFFYMNDGLSYDVVAKDERFIKASKQWKSSQMNFVNAMISLQNALIESSEQASLSVGEESAETMGLKVPNQIQGNPQRERLRRPSHMVFEAIMLQDERTISSEAANPDPAEQTMVFVDNLPIDITVDELEEAYSRCGKVASIHIYNQKPEMDPGPLSKVQVLERRKKQLQSVNNSNFRRWHRPRTPVYASITFEDHEGYRKAADDALRIFGMILRKHQVRSVRPQEMKTLYIEGIPGGIPCVDLEYKLSQQLHPEMFVCLDAGQNNRAIMGSCEIKFPSFELAYRAHKLLQSLDVLSSDQGCSLHWMRTPHDAEKWWTRALGFD